MTSTRGRPSSASGMTSRPVDPPGLLVPHRPHAEQGERLGDVVALGAHGGRAPHDEADGARVRSPVSARWRSTSRSARARPTSHASARRAPPWGRPSRSCGRSAARGRRPGSARRSGRRGRGGRRGRRAGWRARRACGAGRARASLATHRSVGSSSASGVPAGARPAPRPGARQAASTASMSTAAGGVEVDAELGGDRGPQRRDAALAAGG